MTLSPQERKLAEVAAFTATILRRATGKKRRDTGSGWCYVRWADLDVLADELRTLGLDVPANLGIEAARNMEARRQAGRDKWAARFERADS